METDDKLLWRRHVDQVKARVNSPNNIDHGILSDDKSWEFYNPTTTSANTDQDTSVANSHDSETSTSTNEGTSTQEINKYPQRVRKAPDYYKP